MAQIKIYCKKCGKKLLSYDPPGFIRYKSPVKKCSDCQTRYADPRCHEIAIEGIPRDTYNVWSYLFMLIIGALILWRGLALFGMHSLGAPENIQWFLPTMFIIFGIVLIIGGIIEIILIKTGIKQKKFERLAKESEERLNDKSYAYILSDLGYNVPDKYL